MSRWADILPPTGNQCNQKAKVWEDDLQAAYALWYPQMGGYVGKCVVVLDKQGGCFEALVWHDGEFPFEEGDPRVIHHCDPEQFIDFGRQVLALNTHHQRGDRSDFAIAADLLEEKGFNEVSEFLRRAAT